MKKIFFFALFLLCSLTLIGCGGGGDSDEKNIDLPDPNEVPNSPPDAALFGVWEFHATSPATNCSFVDNIEGEETISYYRISQTEEGCRVTRVYVLREVGYGGAEEILENTATLRCLAGGSVITFEETYEESVFEECNASVMGVTRLTLSSDKQELSGILGPYTFSTPGDYRVDLEFSVGKIRVTNVSDKTSQAEIVEDFGINKGCIAKIAESKEPSETQKIEGEIGNKSNAADW